MRGAVALKAFAKGDIVAKVPVNSGIVLGDGTTTEQAYRLLGRLRQDPAFQETFSLYMATMPGTGELFAPEMYTDENFWQLQTPELVRIISSSLAQPFQPAARTAGYVSDRQLSCSAGAACKEEARPS